MTPGQWSVEYTVVSLGGTTGRRRRALSDPILVSSDPYQRERIAPISSIDAQADGSKLWSRGWNHTFDEIHWRTVRREVTCGSALVNLDQTRRTRGGGKSIPPYT